MLKYIKLNIIYIIAIIYFMFSIVLKSHDIVDITVPCLFKTFLDYKCPGCGLTSASIHILNFEYNKAFKTNPLIFIIIPTSIFLFIQNIRKFIRNE